MESCMIDVSDVHTIHVGDEVTVFGNGFKRQQNGHQTVLAGNHSPRIYIRNGEIVDVLTYRR